MQAALFEETAVVIPRAIEEGYSVDRAILLREQPPLPRPAAIISIEAGHFIDRVVVRERPPRPRPTVEIPVVDLTDQDTIPYEPPVVDLTEDQEELEPLVPDLSPDEAIQSLFRRLFRFSEDNMYESSI